jgi:hypothetical protein
LLRFEDEVAAAVQVNAALRGGAVKVVKGDGLFEDVGIEMIFGARRLGTRDFEEVAEFGEKEGVVGALGGGGVLPAFDEARRCIGHSMMIAHDVLR